MRNSADNSQHECQGTLPIRFLPPQIMISPTSAVIRMFGIFTHAQLDRGRFWDSFSQQLQHRGPDYVKRCIFRNKPINAGDSVILPAMFPPLSHQDIPQAVTLVKVREEDMKNVSEMAGRVLNILIKSIHNRSIPCSCTLSLGIVIPLMTNRLCNQPG